MNKELAKTLTTALVQFIDRERPEGSVCCSNSDCANLENAFNAENFIYVESFVKRRLSSLTEFENAFVRFLSMSQGEPPKGIEDFAKEHSKELLALAREQLIKDGYVIEKKAFYDAVKEVPPEVMKEVSDNVDKENELAKKVIDGKDFYPKEYAQPWCLRTGRVCTNPMRDCLNCPREFTKKQKYKGII